MSYSSEEESNSVILPNTLTPVERKLERMLDDRGAWEQEANAFLILRDITLEMMDAVVQERERAALKVEELGMIGYGTLAIAACIRTGDQE
jgi:hypothetical protein